MQKLPDSKVIHRRPRRAVTPTEEAEIMARLKEGIKFSEVGKLMDRDVTVIKRVAQHHAKELETAMAKKLGDKFIEAEHNAFSKYLESDSRKQILCEAMDKIHTMMLVPVVAARDMRELMVSLGIVIDKFAIENGKTDDAAVKALQAIFSKMEQNVEVNVYATPSANGKASEIHNGETSEDEHFVRELEVEQNGGGEPEVA